MGKAVTKVEDNFPAERPEYMGNEERGSDGVGVDDLTIPRLSLIQDLSPQRKKSDAAYIEGAEEGMLFNSVTNQLYGTEVFFVPVYFKKEWVLWKDRTEGGGFRGAFDSAEAADSARNELEDGAQCESVDTHQQFGLIIDAREELATIAGEEAVISMSKSQMKPSRQLNSMVRMAGGDRFSKVYKLEAVLINGPKGDYYNYNVKALGYCPEHIFKQAEMLYEAVSEGVKTVNYEEVADVEETEY